MRIKQALSILITFFALATVTYAGDQIPVASPMTTDLAGRSGATAIPSIFRIQCAAKNKEGTGFLHKSGKIITAAHVVSGCTSSDIKILGVSGKPIAISNLVADDELDLALLIPAEKIDASALPISTNNDFSIGSQVSTWGFPSGYASSQPLLSSGYLSGVDATLSVTGKQIPRWVVNAAFNSGNSGGPLLELDGGTVIGVVSSKLAPIPKAIEDELALLKANKNITQYERTRSDGTKEQISSENILEDILQYLRGQTQLVIGYAVQTKDIKKFLSAHGITP